MTDRKNKFGITSVGGVSADRVSRRRGSGPMSAAVRETAENVAEATEARVEQRKQNAADAREYRAAVEEGRVLARVLLDDISTDDLPRDRLDLKGVASADEMDELKTSIRARGQKEPIELYLDDAGALQLKKGWRRLNALQQLFAETGESVFSTALARIDRGVNDRLRHFVDMVEENILRQDLTYAEMADLALRAASDPGTDSVSPEEMVNRLYGSLHKMKRSHIRSFVTVLSSLSDDLVFPKAVNRDLGLDIARALKERPELVDALRRELKTASDAQEQNAVLRRAIEGGVAMVPRTPSRDRKKFEFHVGAAKVTARKGEVRIKDRTDFTDVSRERLEAAVAAFQKALGQG